MLYLLRYLAMQNRNIRLAGLANHLDLRPTIQDACAINTAPSTQALHDASITRHTRVGPGSGSGRISQDSGYRHSCNHTDVCTTKLSVMFHRRSREMDPFSKTSFDALLDCLADIETPDAPMGVLSDGRDTFPGFDASGPVLAAMANSHVANSAVYQQLQQQQFQQQQQQQYQFRNNQSLMHDTDATRLGHLGFRSSMPLPRTVSMPQSSISPAALQQARLLSLASASMDRVPRSAGPTSRDSCPPSSTGSEVAFLSDGNYCNLTSHPELKRLSDGEGEPNCARQRSSDPGGDAPFLFPRTSLQSFGIHMEPPNGEPKQAASDANKPNEPERRREKNRIAQRRFRERQKTTVAVLQTELDGKQADMDQALSRIRVLEQTNWALTEKLMEYEKLFGPLPSQTPQ